MVFPRPAVNVSRNELQRKIAKVTCCIPLHLMLDLKLSFCFFAYVVDAAKAGTWTFCAGSSIFYIHHYLLGIQRAF